MAADKDVPITTGTLIKWGGFIVAAIGAIVSAIWFVAGQSQTVALQRQDIESLKAKAVEVDNKSADRDARQQREIDELKRKQDAADSRVSQMERKLDVALTILERLDKRFGEKP